MPEGLTFRRFLEDTVAKNPSEPYLIWAPDDSVWTYEQFNAEVDRAAQVWHGLGVRRGDRVSFMLDNRPEFLFAWLGLAKLGAILVAINTGFGPREAGYLVENSQSRLALVGADYLELFQQVQDGSTSVQQVLTLEAAEGHESFLQMTSSATSHAPAVDVQEDDVISLIYTSGTTGHPKGVMQTQRNFVLTGQSYPHWMGMRTGDRIYACLPLFHINSQAYSTMGSIGASGALVLSPKFSASRFWPEVKRHKVNVFNFIGAMTVILSKKEEAPDDADNDVNVAYGVPSLAEDVRDDIERRFGLKVIAGFGMSETTFGLVEPLDERRKAGSMGLPRNHPDPSLPRTQARIVDDDGNDVPDGTTGELLLRNCAMMLGYFNDPERTREALTPDGWLHTGDSAWRDSDGFFYFVDRKKDIVRRRGENVASLEVERVVSEHDAVQEAAVVGVPSELTDEDILVFVVLREGRELDPREIVAWCEERLAKFKIPRYVEFIDELPKTPTSKIEKHRLRDRPPAPDRYDHDKATARNPR